MDRITNANVLQGSVGAIVRAAPLHVRKTPAKMEVLVLPSTTDTGVTAVLDIPVLTAPKRSKNASRTLA